jgi:hypothetical protein
MRVIIFQRKNLLHFSGKNKMYFTLGILWVVIALGLLKFILSFENTSGRSFKIGLILIPASFAVGLFILALGLFYF